ETLTHLLGGAVTRAWVASVEDARGKLRIAMDTLKTEVQGGELPTDLAAIVPKNAIVLDLDHVHPGNDQFSLGKSTLKDFIRSAWQRSKAAATAVRAQLGDGHGA